MQICPSLLCFTSSCSLSTKVKHIKVILFTNDVICQPKKARFEGEMLPLFPVRVRRHVSALGTRKLDFVELLREVFQDRTVPRLLLRRPFTLQLCGGQKRSLPPPPPPSTTSSPPPSCGLKRHSSADLGPTMEELQLGGGSELESKPPLRPPICVSTLRIEVSHG